MKIRVGATTGRVRIKFLKDLVSGPRKIQNKCNQKETKAQNMSIKAVPLGAGQDVGRSCVIVTLGRKNIMFDCGMHMGYNDERRFPDFNFISRTGQYTQNIHCVIISHLYVVISLFVAHCLNHFFSLTKSF